MTDNILEVRGLRKTFVTRDAEGRGEHVAVDDVSFDIPRGSCLAIVGESGSGKTTTARIVAGLETADAGTVTLDGETDTQRRRHRGRTARPVQMVFQDPFGSLDPRQRVGNGIEELLGIHHRLSRTERRTRVLELLTRVGLDEQHAGEFPGNLSGGQRQRVAIARALSMEPKLLILDEAVSALDVSVQAQVLNLLIDIRRQTGITYLFISHDLAVVRQISDHCAVMRNGRVVEEGATAEVLGSPREEYTRTLIDAVPRPGWVPRRRTELTVARE
ncbi:ATP-binding cassette domain-containing protein [Streptomyces sp. NPDC048277]|uniref:ATP-binding cassette domain-containing protein n=1 Tax=Streptomyces sp. NPDC048277 TaxID=3155027 RepID=UPI0033E44778